MSALGLTILDPVVVAVIFVSAMYATYKGFVDETLSIFAWAAAAFATLFFGPKLAPVMHGLFANPYVGALVGYAAIFLVVLIPLSFMSHRFAQTVQSSQVGTLDRSLGFAFGVIRGLAIIGLAFIAFSFVIPVERQPDWIMGAKTRPLILASSQALLSLVPDQGTKTKQEPARPPPQGEAPKPAQTATQPAPKPQPASVKKRAKKAYGAQERRELDRLIETTGGNGKP